MSIPPTAPSISATPRYGGWMRAATVVGTAATVAALGLVLGPAPAAA